MSNILVLAFLFCIGSMIGWCIELIFRRFFTKNRLTKKWVNPGFLVGPCLPLYGFGLCALYLLSSIDLTVIANAPIREILRMIIMALAMTVIEYIAGIIFIKRMNVKLWDYSDEWGNIQGIICPRFSLYWALIGAFYYFLIHPYILDALNWLANNLAFSFFIGVFFGICIIDFAYSIQILKKVRAFAAENQIIVKYEELKDSIRASLERQKEKYHFMLAFKTDHAFSEHLKGYLEIANKKINSGIKKIRK